MMRLRGKLWHECRLTADTRPRGVAAKSRLTLASLSVYLSADGRHTPYAATLPAGREPTDEEVRLVLTRWGRTSHLDRGGLHRASLYAGLCRVRMAEPEGVRQSWRNRRRPGPGTESTKRRTL